MSIRAFRPSQRPGDTRVRLGAGSGWTNADSGVQPLPHKQVSYVFGRAAVGKPENIDGSGLIDLLPRPHCPDCGYPHYARSCRRCGSRRAAQ